MNKKSIFRTLSLVALSFTIVFTACEKDEHDDHSHDTSDQDKPVITMSSPSDLQVYNSGDTVRIKGMVTDASLHELVIKILKDSDNSELFKEAPVVHDLTSYTIDTYWKSAVSGHTNVTVVVLAEDHSGNVSSDTTKIHVMP